MPAAAPQIPVSTGVELLTNPARVAAAVRLLNQIANARVQIIPASTKGTSSVVFSGQSAIIPLPIQLPTQIADSAATAASVSTQLNLLLAGLRTVGILPS